ncbi:hypothetical protein OJF2_39610 [Aquisphaera giovannonii]|uniref:Uncharacterized protein n=1 Tax=Aquisphaera giovannonii TaxID=406548 RepID=A0A5B9W5J3_9BACT|nr:hypothetical protein [Aquisphaera giovannonii]QEH35409.1 hypothetical protein OJF2_39610 [Aquisphaera giovannonii]
MEGKSPEDAGKPLAPKAAVGCLFALISVPAVFAAKFVEMRIGDALGIQIKPDVHPVLLLTVFGLTHQIVNVILKRQRFAHSGKTVETWYRADLEAIPESAEKGRVEIHAKRGLNIGFGAASLGFSLAGAASLLHPDGMRHWPQVLACVGAFGVCSAGCFYELNHGKPQAWADAYGVTGYPRRFGFRRRFVPWSRIDSCDIETHHDPRGRLVGDRLVTLKDAAGKRLLTMAFSGLTEDPAPLIKAIRAHLPKADTGLEGW